MSGNLQIGLIGLGNAGRALLKALSAQASVKVYDRDPARCSGLGAIVAESSAQLARECDVILLSLPNPAASLAVANDIRGLLRPGTIVVETSTVGPDDVEALNALLSPGGAEVIDAAIVGGVAKLAAGEGVFLIGAAADQAGAAGELLRAIAAEAHFLARRGDGMRTKIAVNAVAHAVYAVLVEAGALAAAQGIPVDLFEHLMTRESGLTRPLTHRFTQRLRKHDFDGGMSAINAAKDSALAMAAAEQLGVPFDTIAAAHQAYERAIAAGVGALDYAALGTLWEQQLGIDFGVRNPADQD